MAVGLNIVLTIINEIYENESFTTQSVLFALVSQFLW